jgi:hypothetical protein
VIPKSTHLPMEPANVTPSVTVANAALVSLEPWDPLARVDEDPGVYAAAQKREIRNILKSYTGYFDLFSEMIQNALDAVEKRKSEAGANYKPLVSIHIDIGQSSVTVVDNGCAMVLAQFRLSRPPVPPA